MDNFEHGIIPSTVKSDQVVNRDIGGKARNLFRLREAGFDIPDWWVVSSHVFDNTIKPVRQTITDLLEQTNFDDAVDIDRTAGKIRDTMLTLQLPQDSLHQLQTSLMRERKTRTFAVRSSVRDEDSAKHSFAGLMESFLNQRLEDLQESIRQVWVSAFSSRALMYRWKKGVDIQNISAAVIIQEMIPAKSAGVLFTHDPNSLLETCVITAAIGLGEGVTSDFADTDTYRVDWHSNSIHKQVSKKTTKVIELNESSGTRSAAVAHAAQQIAVLSDDQIQELCELAMRASTLYKKPLDIEWAFDNEGKCWLLQARPIIITKQSNQIRIWDNANIVESYPGVTLPLTFSFVRKHYERTFRQLALTAFKLRHSYWEQHHVFRNLFGLINGRVYLNLLSWYQMLSFLPGFKQRKAAWDRMFGIDRQIDFARTPISLIEYASIICTVAKTLLTVNSGKRHFDEWFQPLYDKFKSIDLEKLDECELAETYQQLVSELTERWYLTLRNDFCTMTYYDWLQSLCHHWGPDDRPNLHNDLLQGQTLIESITPARSIDHLADMLKQHDEYQTLISLQDNAAILERIQNDKMFSTLKDAFYLHIEKFGDRSVEELKLEVPSFREEPERVIETIKERLHATRTIDEIETRAKDARYQSEIIMRQSIRNPLKRAVLQFVLSNARSTLANRESMRLARGRVFGLVRRIFNHIGTLFTEKELLESSKDIFYLDVDEIMDFINGSAVTQDMRANVKLRREEYASFENHEPSSRFQTTGLVYENVPSMAVTDMGESNKAVGIGCSSGTASGPARIIRNPANATINEGDIIVAYSTDPAWVYLMTACRGIVVERGSVLSHTSIIGRELGIPTIIGVPEATNRIWENATITIDGQTGLVQWQ
jgi:pyruvate,water dikinase